MTHPEMLQNERVTPGRDGNGSLLSGCNQVEGACSNCDQAYDLLRIWREYAQMLEGLLRHGMWDAERFERLVEAARPE